MTHCSTLVKEAAWSLSQDGESAAISARARAEFLADIAAHFTFSKDNSQCFLDAAGNPVQLAMALTEIQTGARLTVTVRQCAGFWRWEVEGRRSCPFTAADLIACVRQRVGAKLSGQLSGRVN